MQRVAQIDLDAVVVFEHLEANRVAAADELLRWIDPHVEVIGEQIVVGAVLAVVAAQ